jgi:type IX secretion system PorP/SprF family membrane protein
MKNFYLRILLILFSTSIAVTAFSQDIHFSQFTETPLYRNPALAGIVTGDVRVQTVYRTQWNSIANAYKTASLSAEYKLPIGNADDFITAGAQIFYDRAGTTALTSTHMMPAVNYHKSISNVRNMYLSVGFMGGLIQRSFDRSKITTNHNYEGGIDGENFNQTSYSYFDGAVGMSLNSSFSDNENDNFYLGAAYHHFNKPKGSFFQSQGQEINPKYVFSGGIKFGVTEYSYVAIEADHTRQGVFQETIGGIMYGLKVGPYLDQPDYVIHGGAYLRWNDAFIPTVKLDYKPFTVAFSYDLNISKLKTSSYGRGGFELSLAYIGLLDRANSTLNSIRCPRY